MPVTELNALPAFLKFRCDSHPGRVVFSHSDEKISDREDCELCPRLCKVTGAEMICKTRPLSSGGLWLWGTGRSGIYSFQR